MQVWSHYLWRLDTNRHVIFYIQHDSKRINCKKSGWVYSGCKNLLYLKLPIKTGMIIETSKIQTQNELINLNVKKAKDKMG